jgi:hypothetical protein
MKMRINQEGGYGYIESKVVSLDEVVDEEGEEAVRQAGK